MKTAQERIDDFIARPTLARWQRVRDLIIPGTMRTMWQAWRAVDDNAPVKGPMTVYPDAFTMRRGLAAARAGGVPVGLGRLSRPRPEAPRETLATIIPFRRAP